MIGRRIVLSVSALVVTSTVRAAGGGVVVRQAIATATRTSSMDPDAELLALCVVLEERAAEWQRLYDVTSDELDLTTAADRAWQTYNDTIWPGTHISEWDASRRHPEDIVARLHDLHPVTPDGLQAKAAAIVALDDAASYGDLRNDAYELNISLIRDAAGSARRPLGEPA